MENKARKMFAAVVVIMLCAVAIVGVGYAYTASTVNTGNTTTSTYVTLTQQTSTDDATAKYSFGNPTIVYDTINVDATHTYYKIGTPYTSISGYSLYTIGSVTLKATPTNETPSAALSVAVSSQTMVANDGWVYIISDGTRYQVLSNNDGSSMTGWTGDPLQIAFSDSAWQPTVVTLYYGYADSSTIQSGVGQGYMASQPVQLTSSGVVVFTATISNPA